MLANIDSELSTIQNGRYGEDIRTAIKDAISKVNNAGYMPVVENLNVVENGTYTPSAGVNGFSKVVVNVPGGGGGYPEPTGTISITENGTVNVKDYASANVNVQPNLQSKTATQNGTVTADSGYDGLSSVDVNVSGSGMLSGTTEPEVSLGADGDVYLQYIDMSIPPGVTIPTDCEILTYIEATGTQWVMTDYIPVSNTRLVMDCMLLGAANYYTLFGERRNTSSEGFYILCNGGNWKFMGNSGETGFSNALPLIERITIEAAYGEATWTNGSDSGQCTPTAGTTANTLPLFLFTLNSNGSDFGTSTHAKMRLYGLSIYEGDTLVRRYVPLLD